MRGILFITGISVSWGHIYLLGGKGGGSYAEQNGMGNNPNVPTSQKKYQLRFNVQRFNQWAYLSPSYSQQGIVSAFSFFFIFFFLLHLLLRRLLFFSFLHATENKNNTSWFEVKKNMRTSNMLSS